MAQKWLIAILAMTFAFVVMPFLLWYLTTFSRPLSPIPIWPPIFTMSRSRAAAQHALSQVADRIISPIPAVRESAKPWYPEVIALASQSGDELRVTAAWVMGQDNQSPEFHAALLKMLTDKNPMVQRNAALSLVRFDDTSGHDIIVGMLSPTRWAHQQAASLAQRLKVGDVINPGTMVGRINVASEQNGNSLRSAGHNSAVACGRWLRNPRGPANAVSRSESRRWCGSPSAHYS